MNDAALQAESNRLMAELKRLSHAIKQPGNRAAFIATRRQAESVVTEMRRRSTAARSWWHTFWAVDTATGNVILDTIKATSIDAGTFAGDTIGGAASAALRASGLLTVTVVGFAMWAFVRWKT